MLRDKEMLAALGYEPVGFERPADAIAARRVSPDRFDAVLVSHGAPNPDGVLFAYALHELMPRQPILFATLPTIDVGTDAPNAAGNVTNVTQFPIVEILL